MTCPIPQCPGRNRMMKQKRECGYDCRSSSDSSARPPSPRPIKSYRRPSLSSHSSDDDDDDDDDHSTTVTGSSWNNGDSIVSNRCLPLDVSLCYSVSLSLSLYLFVSVSLQCPLEQKQWLIAMKPQSSCAPCRLWGCKNGPALFPGQMLYKATKPGSA